MHFNSSQILHSKRTDDGQPMDRRVTNIYIFTLQRVGPSPSPNFKSKRHINIKTFGHITKNNKENREIYQI